MKLYFYIFLIAILLNNNSVVASETTQCFEKAWAHPGDGGLGLTSGQAIELCHQLSD